jgi:osmotically-inducible protein OsmY
MTMGSSQVRKQVLAALNKDSRTSDAIIEVIDNNGVVTLRGTVSSQETHEVAEEITRKQERVISVINELEVEQDELQLAPPLIVPPPTQNQ